MKHSPSNIADASRQVTQLESASSITLPGGREITLHRLSWLEFERVWRAASRVLAVLLLADEEITEERLAAELAAAPSVVSALVAGSARTPADDLQDWPFEDVLAAGAAAAQLNFVDSRGLRDFFSVAQQLAGQGSVEAARSS